MKSVIKKIISCSLVLSFVLQNFLVFAEPKNPLTEKILGELETYFADHSMGANVPTEIEFPAHGQTYMVAGGIQDSRQHTPTNLSDYRELRVYNIPYMLSYDGEGHNDFLRSILSLYIESKRSLESELERYQDPSGTSKDVTIARLLLQISKNLEAKYNSDYFSNDSAHSIKKDVEDIAFATGYSIEEAKTACFAAVAFKSLSDEYDQKAVHRASAALASALIGGGAAVSAAILGALKAAGVVTSVGAPVIAVIVGVAILAGGFAIVAYKAAKGYKKEAAKLARNYLMEQRRDNGASLVKQIIGNFTNSENYNRLQNSNVLILAIDTRNFSVENDVDAIACKDTRNDGAWCQFTTLNLHGSPVGSEYTSPQGRKIDFLIQLFRAVSRSNGEINYDALECYIDGNSLPLILRPATEKKVIKLARRGSTPDVIADILEGEVTVEEVAKYYEENLNHD